MTFDFTLKELEKLYKAIIPARYEIVTFLDYMRNMPSGKAVILRHDVDKRVQNALEVARIEHNMGIKSSFYFRCQEGEFDTKAIKEISGLGHETGYHYEVLSKTRGNLEKGIELFKKELSELRRAAEVKTICMHGSPLSKYDSRQLWAKYDYRDFGIAGEPYFDIDYDRAAYFTDTGRRWDGKNVNVRDKVGHGITYSFRTTSQLIAAFKENKLPDRVMINIHPQRWHENFLLWTTELIGQNLKNIIKGCLVRFRSRHVAN